MKKTTRRTAATEIHSSLLCTRPKQRNCIVSSPIVVRGGTYLDAREGNFVAQHSFSSIGLETAFDSFLPPGQGLRKDYHPSIV